ncbi:class I adenylate-forming enzyme family protein [Pseudoalteromonas sp. YIC-656]|uniref:class I adenylate-forming enzyme family protein n=1 Tax=Pseudoalteromonas pernae TaxID=3118054 RepID=UPI003241C1C3
MSANLYTDIQGHRADKVCLHQGDKSLTYGEFYRAIEHFARALQARGVKQGDRIAVERFSGSDLLTAYYGSALLGVSVVPLPFVDEERIIGAMQASGAVLKLDSMPSADESVKDDLSFGNNDEAMVIFTSGTTSSKLKGVRLAHQGISEICHYMNDTMQMNAQCIELVFASLDHAFGFGRCHSILQMGGTLVLPTSLNNPFSVFKLIEQHQCNAFSSAPSMIAALLRLGGEELSSLVERIKWIQTGAMRFDPLFRKQLCEALPKTRIFLHYGLSEAMRVTFFELNTHLHKAGTEGLASGCSRIRIVNECGEVLAQGESGRIAIQGSNLCLGYLDDEYWQSQLLDGWFATSDLGYLDEDQFLVFLGRYDDVINYNGVLVHPDEIESKLVSLFPKNAFCVVGIPDPGKVKDAIVTLCVEGETSISMRDVANHMQGKDANLMPNKLVKVDTLPKTRSGKVSRAELIKQLVS